MFQEEICESLSGQRTLSTSSVIGFKGSQDDHPSDPTSPKVKRLVQQLQKRSPPTIRKTSLPSPKRLSPPSPRSPKTRKVFDFGLKSVNGKVQAKSIRKRALPISKRDQYLHAWSQSILKDFNAIVEEQISVLKHNDQKILLPFNQSEGCNESNYRSLRRDPPAKQLLAKRHSLPPKPPPRTSKSKLLQLYKSTSSSRPVLIRSLSWSDRKAFFEDSHPNLKNLPDICRSNSTGSMGAGTSSLPQGVGDRNNCPYTIYTLPRGRRRVSLGSHLNSSVTPDHPDAEVSPCQLLRVGPRLSRSHSLDEGFVPLSQRIYFEPTPAPPAPTPQLKKENLYDRIRRKGVTQGPSNMPWNEIESHFNFLSSTALDYSCTNSNSSMLNPQVTEYPSSPRLSKDLAPSYADSYVSTSAHSTLSWKKNTTAQEFPSPSNMHASANPSLLPSSVRTLPPRVDASALSVERYRGRKSEPSLLLNLSHPLSEGRRHTLPNRPGLIHPLPPPVFNASSWDALPPAEEVEVMEDKPIQTSSGFASSRSRQQNATVEKCPVITEKCLTLPATHFFFTKSGENSPSLNSSLSSLSSVCARNDTGLNDSDFDSKSHIVKYSLPVQKTGTKTDKDVIIVNSSVQTDRNCQELPELLDQDISSKADKEQVVPSTYPVSSPEPITAKLQLKPLTNNSDSTRMFFSVVVPDNYKRKKKKVRPKRHSDTCLVAKSKTSELGSSKDKRNSTNFCSQAPLESTDEEEDRSRDSEGNKSFIRFCKHNLKSAKGDPRFRKLLIDQVTHSPKHLPKENVTSNRKDIISRRSWGDETKLVASSVAQLRSSLSEKNLLISVMVSI